jgi:lactate permease
MPASLIAASFEQSLTPIADSLWLSAVVAMLPLVTIFVLLGWLKLPAYVAGLAALGVAAAVAVLGFGMPIQLTFLSATQGAVFGLFPILAIVLMALWIYQLTVVTGRFEDLRSAFGYVSGDPRVQAIIVAFCFGALLEALAGFGAPVAITGVMLMAVGFSPLRAAGVVLVANTAPVAFGAIGIPIITAGELTNIPYEDIGAYVGRQTPILALFVPLILVYLADGRRGVRQTWPVALVAGAAFAVAQFVSSNFISVELTDIIAALASLAAVVVLLRVWQPEGGQEARDTLAGLAKAERETGRPLTPGTADTLEPTGGVAVVAPAAPVAQVDPATKPRLSAARMTMAFLPYLLVVAVFSIAQLVTPVKAWLASTDVAIEWPWLDGNIIGVTGVQSSSTVYNFAWLSSAGTLLLLCGVVVAVAYRLSPTVALGELVKTAVKLKGAAMTVCAVLALAYVMNQSGQTVTIGAWIAGTGAAFAFLSPILGWLGTAVTGSDTSANALFATLQQEAAIKAGIDPTLLVAANTSGGVVGKMISLQNLAIAASAVGIVGRESELLRFAIRWSVGLLFVICLLVGLQSTPVLGWMLP